LFHIIAKILKKLQKSVTLDPSENENGRKRTTPKSGKKEYKGY
jgi:hypothetical protein